MKHFDYAAAWREVAAPAYEALPANVRALVDRVGVEAADLGQLRDLTMPWPEDSDLRSTFEKIPAEVLAHAARVVYFGSHWHPGGKKTPRLFIGAGWKFSHYADQSLRDRLILAASADVMRTNGPFQVIEGAIRLCYSSRDMWMWREVAPATVNGLERARALAAELSAVLAVAGAERGRALSVARDSAAYDFMEELSRRDLGWPDYWRPWVNTADRYMREQSEIDAATEAAKTPEERTAEIQRRKAEEVARAARSIWTAERRRDGQIWAIDHGLPSDNLIFYDHQNDKQGVFCFGWREKIGPATEAAILAVISEFPYAYRIECADGRKLEGGIG